MRTKGVILCKVPPRHFHQAHVCTHAQTQLPGFMRIPNYTLQPDVFILTLDSRRNVVFVHDEDGLCHHI